ncbi:MAG: threonine synthase, partial [Alphaproteobacteria bacterium]|nr:threonine synthase [Alphaproteobacteria bacterium]
MIFRSTRGLAPEADIRAIAMTGLAPDGGLYLPKEWPCFSPQDIAAFSQMPYEDIACFVLRPFLEGAVSDGELREIVRKSYAAFVSPDVAPLRD